MHNTKIHRPVRGFSALVACTAIVVAAPATADIIEIGGYTPGSTEGIGNFSGSLEYSTENVFSTTGLLTVSLTNTSNESNGGYLTGFVFNITSSDSDASASLLSGNFSLVGISNASAAPFGTFDAGAAIGGNWLGGGAPHGGIGVGQTGIFEFLVNAGDAGSLTAESFLGNFGDNGFVVRFRGFVDGGSDKVPGVSITYIPAPAALGLFLLAGLTGRRRRYD